MALAEQQLQRDLLSLAAAKREQSMLLKLGARSAKHRFKAQVLDLEQEFVTQV